MNRNCRFTIAKFTFYLNFLQPSKCRLLNGYSKKLQKVLKDLFNFPKKSVATEVSINNSSQTMIFSYPFSCTPINFPPLKKKLCKSLSQI